MMEAYPGIENTEMFSVLSRCMKERTSEHMENEFSYTNGKKRWFELRIQPVPEGIFVLSIDITDRKKAEERLKEVGEKFESYFDLAQVIMVAIDVQGNVTHINKKGCEILGYKKETIVGKNWFSIFLPERLRKETKAYFKKILSEQIKPVEYHENPVLTRGGKERLIAWHNTLLRDEQGKIKSTLSSGEDITERKKAEEKIRRLAKFPSENPNPVLRISKGGTVLFVNKAAKIIINESKQDKKLQTLKLLKQAAFDSLHSGVTKEVEIKHNDKVFLFVFAPITDGGYCNVYGLDITELKKVEKALNDSVGALSLVNEKLGVVGTLTRHDVRNKLSVVAGNLFIAKELLPPDHEAVKYLEKAEPAFEQITQIFDRARAYERLGVDKLSYVDVKKSCEEAVSLVHDLGNIETVKDCEGLSVYADSLLGQLFYNLIDNSIKHGEKVSKIRIYYKESEDGLRLIYEDDGVGIAKSEKEKIFGEDHGKGSRIGLRMIKIMCNIYGWTIHETGKKGKGVQFIITIPKKTKDGKKAYISSTRAK